MRLSDKYILEFQNLYLKEFGTSLSEDEALERSEKLIELVRVIYKPIPKEDYAKYKLQDNSNISNAHVKEQLHSNLLDTAEARP